MHFVSLFAWLEETKRRQSVGRTLPAADTNAKKDTWHYLNVSPDPFFQFPTTTSKSFRPSCPHTTHTTQSPHFSQKHFRTPPGTRSTTSSDDDPVRLLLHHARTRLVTRPGKLFRPRAARYASLPAAAPRSNAASRLAALEGRSPRRPNCPAREARSPRYVAEGAGTGVGTAAAAGYFRAWMVRAAPPRVRCRAASSLLPPC